MRRLVLAARDAALRFASARRGKARGAWPPLVLRWRRRRKRQEQHRVSRPVVPGAAPAAVWLAHVHLHFAPQARDRRSGEGPRRVAPAGMVRETRSLETGRHHRSFFTRTRVASRHEMRSFTAATMREMRRIEVSRHHRSFASRTRVASHREEVRSFFAATIRETRQAERSRVLLMPAAISTMCIVPRRIVPRPIVDRSRQRLFRSTSTTRNDVRVSTRTTDERAGMHSFERQTRIHTAKTRTVERQLRESATPSQVRPGRSPELLWRSAPRPTTVIATEEPRPAGRPAPALEPAPEGAARAIRPPLQMRDLDPALLDRLTGDVIRRVERRARIERERRGL